MRNIPPAACLGLAAILSGFGSFANVLDVPVMETGGDGQAANCASSTVRGLDPAGDGFLAVRTGPGTQYAKIAELHEGDLVIVFQVQGNWAGIVYNAQTIQCAATRTQPVAHPNTGWVSRKWLADLAG